MAKQRILVVDDDREVVRLMRAYLEQAGYEVLAAYDGETAVHTLRREKPDLVLLDLMLPDRDGYDITRLVRADATLAHIPIIMLTARVEDTDKAPRQLLDLRCCERATWRWTSSGGKCRLTAK